MISKDEYLNWKNHPVTVEFFKNVTEVAEEVLEAHLDGVSVQDHAVMAHQVGLIRAWRTVTHYSPEFNDDGYMIDDEGAIVE